jgi:hypothetical protein
VSVEWTVKKVSQYIRDPFLSATDDRFSSMRRNARNLIWASLLFAAAGVGLGYLEKFGASKLAMDFAETVLYVAVGGQVGQKGIEKFSAALESNRNGKVPPKQPERDPPL